MITIDSPKPANITKDERPTEYSLLTPRMYGQGSELLEDKNLTQLVERVQTERWLVEFICEPANMARATAIASEQTLRKIWDTPEEDEAWRDL